MHSGGLGTNRKLKRNAGIPTENICPALGWARNEADLKRNVGGPTENMCPTLLLAQTLVDHGYRGIPIGGLAPPLRRAHLRPSRGPPMPSRRAPMKLQESPCGVNRRSRHRFQASSEFLRNPPDNLGLLRIPWIPENSSGFLRIPRDPQDS